MNQNGAQVADQGIRYMVLPSTKRRNKGVRKYLDEFSFGHTEYKVTVQLCL